MMFFQLQLQSSLSALIAAVSSQVIEETGVPRETAYTSASKLTLGVTRV